MKTGPINQWAWLNRGLIEQHLLDYKFLKELFFYYSGLRLIQPACLISRFTKYKTPDITAKLCLTQPFSAGTNFIVIMRLSVKMGLFNLVLHYCVIK